MAEILQKYWRVSPLLYLLTAVLVLVAGARLVCPAGICEIAALDASLLTAIHAWRHPVLDGIFIGITALGSIVILLPLSVVLVLPLRGQLPLRQVVFLPLAVSGATVLATLAKFAAARPRPDLFPAVIEMPLDASFPSAHTIQVVAFASAWLLRPGRRSKVGAGETALFVLVVFSVALSRLYLQVHFPSDVMFGALAGILWVMALQRWTLNHSRRNAMDAGSRHGAA